jgi:hypothetical protein
MVAARPLDHVGHEFRSDRGSALVLLVLSSIRKERDNSRYPLRARDLAGVYHDAELHQCSIDCSAAGGNDVHVVLSNRFANLDSGFTHSAPGHFGLAQRETNAEHEESKSSEAVATSRRVAKVPSCNDLCQLRVAGPCSLKLDLGELLVFGP